MPLTAETRNITTMRLPAELLRELTRIAIRRGVSRTKLVEREMLALVKREAEREMLALVKSAAEEGDDKDPFA